MVKQIEEESVTTTTILAFSRAHCRACARNYDHTCPLVHRWCTWSAFSRVGGGEVVFLRKTGASLFDANALQSVEQHWLH